jgi:hypothetical protein
MLRDSRLGGSGERGDAPLVKIFGKVCRENLNRKGYHIIITTDDCQLTLRHTFSMLVNKAFSWRLCGGIRAKKER